MTNNIPRIGINTNSVNTNGHQTNGSAAAPEDNKPQQPPVAPPTTQVNPDDVLSLMAQQAVVAQPTVPRTYDVSKYVDADQAARIAALMADFEAQVEAGLVAIDDELGDWLPEEAKYEIAAGMVE